MCSLCSALLTDHWTEASGGRRGGVLRVQTVNRVLSHFDLELRDWAGRVYVLHDRKGRSSVVDDLGSLWREAELLLGRPLDPLDSALVRELSA